MLIVLIGPDGVGKTSIATELCTQLQQRFPNKNIKFSKYFEDYFILKLLMIPFKNRRSKIAQSTFFDMRKMPFFVKNIWPYLVYMDQVLLYCWLKFFRRNVVYITDRYTYSFLVSWKYYRMNNILIDFLYSRFPMPDFCFVLFAKPSLLMERKFYQRNIRTKSYNLEFFIKHFNLYNQLCNELSLSRIDNENSLNDTVQCILTRIKL